MEMMLAQAVVKQILTSYINYARELSSCRFSRQQLHLVLASPALVERGNKAKRAGPSKLFEPLFTIIVSHITFSIAKICILYGVSS